MTADHTARRERTMQLLAHQLAFVDMVAESTEPKVVVLEGEVGLGKSVALVAACARLITTDPATKVLLVAHKALGDQFVSLLGTLHVQAAVVDRYRFREMIDAGDGRATWPQGQVSVLGWDFARQPDVTASLRTTRWNLLVADEAHSAAGRRLEFLRSMIGAADRVLLGTATPPAGGFDAILGEPVKSVRWRRADIAANSGQNLSLSLPPTLKTISYVPSEAELALGTLIERIAAEAGSIDSKRQAVLPENLRRARRSGPTALENALRGLLQGAATPDQPGDLDERADDGGEASSHEASGTVVPDGSVVPLVTSALTALEELEVDSKLAAFSAFIDARTPTAGEDSPRICVVTAYVATLFYLAAELEGRGREAYLVHGSMSSEERSGAFNEFAAGTGVLLATHAALEGIELPNVSDVILYDVPRSFAALQNILGRFDRIGRKGVLRIHVLASAAEPHPIDESTRRALNDVAE